MRWLRKFFIKQGTVTAPESADAKQVAIKVPQPSSPAPEPKEVKQDAIQAPHFQEAPTPIELKQALEKMPTDAAVTQVTDDTRNPADAKWSIDESPDIAERAVKEKAVDSGTHVVLLKYPNKPQNPIRISGTITCHRCDTAIPFSQIESTFAYMGTFGSAACPNCHANFDLSYTTSKSGTQATEKFISVIPHMSPGGNRLYPLFTITGVEELTPHSPSEARYGEADFVGDVYGVGLSRDGKYLVSSGSKFVVWNAETREVIHELPRNKANYPPIAISPDGHYVCAPTGTDVCIWNVATGQEIRRLNENGDQVWTISFTSDSQHVLTAANGIQVQGTTFERCIRLWDVKTGKEEKRFNAKYGYEPIRCAAISADDGYVMYGSQTGVIRVWNAKNGEQIFEFEEAQRRNYVNCVAFSPDTKYFMAGTNESIRIWELQTRRQKYVLDTQGTKTLSAVFSPKGKQLFSSHSDGMVRVWDLANGKLERRMEESTHEIRSICLSSDGCTLITGCLYEIRRWDVADS